MDLRSKVMAVGNAVPARIASALFVLETRLSLLGVRSDFLWHIQTETAAIHVAWVFSRLDLRNPTTSTNPTL